MKQYLVFVFCSLFAGLSSLNVDVASKSALLINSKTGKVLFEKNSSEVMYPASCTKIAFALYAIKFHQGRFSQKIVCSNNALKSLTEAQKSKNNYANFPSHILETDASHMGLKVGEQMSFYDLLEGSMIVSADDASNVLAEVMGNGSIEACVEDVNRYLRSIGCSRTHFKNPHGLHHPEHVTTAQDLAILCQEAMKEPIFRQMVQKASFSRPHTNKQKAVQLATTNRLIKKGTSYYYPHAVGIKTGYHRRAGHCLATQAEKDGRALISVTLQAPSRDDRFSDTKKLFEAAFQERLMQRVVVPGGEQTFQTQPKGAKSAIKTVTNEAIAYSFYPSEEPDARLELVWHDLTPPIKQGQAVGELMLFLDGAASQKAVLYAANPVEKETSYWPFALLGLGLILGLFMVMRKR